MPYNFNGDLYKRVVKILQKMGYRDTENNIILQKEVYINMDIRILRYFLTVAKEQNFTKAARTIEYYTANTFKTACFIGEELGTALFIRGSRSITLAETGILLKRRALEIIDLEEKMLDEIKAREELIEGTITVGCVKFVAAETLAEICKI